MSCGGESEPIETNDEKIISRTVRDMEVLSSNNGSKTRLMRAPLMESHAFANPSFEEFREGMEVIGYDSLGLNPASRVVADHALHWADRDLWQLSGNVVVEGEEGEKLYTQQLFWDVKTHKIWSNVDSKVEETGNIFYGVGFEAMDDFSDWEFRDVDGTMWVDAEPTATPTPTADSVGVGSGVGSGMPIPPDVPTSSGVPIPPDAAGSSTPAAAPAAPPTSGDAPVSAPAVPADVPTLSGSPTPRARAKTLAPVIAVPVTPAPVTDSLTPLP